MNASKVERRLGRALTVEDLIAELEQYPKEARVVFACDYGDICHTQQALPVESIAEMQDEEELVDSAYSKSGIALQEIEIDEDEEPEHLSDLHGEDRQVVVLR